MKTPSEIISSAKRLSLFAPPTIHISYKLFLDYFSGPLSEKKVLAGAYMVYGWMPTMLRLKGPKEAVIELASAGRMGKIDVLTLEACAKTLNNSLVGTTKLLHFIAPDKYPIWDSRVYRALYGKNPHPYRVENTLVYMDYLGWVSQMEMHSDFYDLMCRFQDEAGYKVSSKRVAEAVLYALGPKPKKMV